MLASLCLTIGPQINFERCAASIPDGSVVLLVFGEIDCREGILVAVEKDRYASVEEGICATQAHYLATLTSLAERLVCLVHPIVPVLDETRNVVKHYNALLEAAVKRMSNPNVRWVDGVFAELLSADGSLLKDEFKLDGTHLHPSYVTKLLAPAIASMLAPRVE